MADTASHASNQSARRPGRRVEMPPSSRGFDAALVFGLIFAFGLVTAALVIGGSVSSFYNLPALLIVLLGTFAVTMVSFTVREVLAAMGQITAVMFPKSHAARPACERILHLASISREHGVLALESALPQLRGEPFLQRAIALTVDGSDQEQVARVLKREIETIADRRERMASVLRRAAEVAPSMGLIGTLVGLIQLLGNLDDPSQIGPAMAVALLTTFYGAVMAYMVFAPIAAKLERNTADEILVCEIYLAGALSMCRQENPRLLETYLNTKLPLSDRLDYFG
jgi:chemotaxis protein MotA